MLRCTIENGKRVCVVDLAGRFGVYLDNHSIIDLAKGSRDRRRRFVDALKNRGTLLFSLTNAAEVAGPQGRSASDVKAFLDSVGPYWVPLELNPCKVVNREKEGLGGRAPVSDGFMRAYFMSRLQDRSQTGSSSLDPTDESFFRLGCVVDWVQEQQENIRQESIETDRTVQEYLKYLRAEYEKDHARLDKLVPPVSFSEERRATFVYNSLLRILVDQAKAFQFKKHDGLDLCHAVLAAAYANFATLDKQWKRRVENLPKPNGVAKVYYSQELDKLVDLVDSHARAS